MNIDLSKPRLVSIFGYTGGGKSNFLKYLLKELKNHKILVVDFHNEYAKLDKYTNIDRVCPKTSVKNNQEELNKFLDKAIKHAKDNQYNLIAIDEANQYMVSKNKISYAMVDLKNNHRHYNLSAFFIMRRPTQFDTDIIEQSHYLVAFSIKGKNTVKYFNDLSDGMGDAITRLSQYEYVLADPDRDFRIHNPCPNMD